MTFLLNLLPRARNQNFGRSIDPHSVRNYERLVRRKLKEFPKNRALALAQSVGSPDLEAFQIQGDGQTAVLFHHGLRDGMVIYDLGCGCGRTAQALQRAGWIGSYHGADIIPELVEELNNKCPNYDAIVHRDLSIAAENSSIDILFGWSIFTHTYPEESFLYIMDAFRALRPGGRLIFSFLELENKSHHKIFHKAVEYFQRGVPPPHLDAFLHRDWIRFFAREIGFNAPNFTDGNDARFHPAFWQSLAVLDKPL